MRGVREVRGQHEDPVVTSTWPIPQTWKRGEQGVRFGQGLRIDGCGLMYTVVYRVGSLGPI